MDSADEGYSEAPLNTSFSSKSPDGSLSSGRLGGRETSAALLRHISDLSVSSKTQLVMSLLEELPTSVIAEIVQRLSPRLYIDFIRYLPTEICLKILGYLDPLSLICVAKACRAWYDLALDRKLWEKLYYREGWKAVPSEIQVWEEKINGGVLGASAYSGHLHRLRSSDDGHTHKKRSITAPDDAGGDPDFVMIDADRAVKQEPADIEMGEASIFGGGPSSASRTCMTPGLSAMSMGGGSGSSYDSRADPKGKGVDTGKGKAVAAASATSYSSARELAALAASIGVRPESLPDMTEPPGSLARSTLWTWDSTSARYRINWKYLYSTRHRLEANWDSGKFTNFQFPHPDYPGEGHHECIYTLQFNSEFLVSGSRDRTIRIWNMHTRRLVRPPLAAHHGSVLCLQFDSDPDEDIIVSGSSDSDVIIWKFSTGQMIQRLQRAHAESVLNVKFDKRILVTCSKDKTIKIFNRRDLRPGEPGYSTEGMVHPVGTRVKVYGTGYDTLDQLPIKPAFTMIGALVGHGAAVNAVQIVGNEVVSASGDRNLKIWDWPTQHCLRTYVGHSKGIACVQYDGKRIVSGSSDNEVKVFDRQTGVEVASLRAHTDLVRTVQAGFADLPYSDYEDLQEAKRIDQGYFDAVVAQTLPGSLKRGRPGNSGSSRPEEITAFGAKLPPGGGGGKFARIVSGSYDQSIIIWKRDKEGAWKKHHHLKQEEAADVAARSMDHHHSPLPPPQQQPPVAMHHALASAAASQAAGDAGVANTLSMLRAQRQLDASSHHSSSSASASASAAAIAAVSVPTTAVVVPPSFSSSSASSLSIAPPSIGLPELPANTPAHVTGALTRLIDATVPQGVVALQSGLARHPDMLAMQPQLQAAIDREPSSHVRAQLRQAVSTALVRTQLAQTRSQRVHLTGIQSRNAAALAASRAGPSSGSGDSATAVVAGPSSNATASSSVPVPGSADTLLRPQIPTTNSAPAVLASSFSSSSSSAAAAGPSSSSGTTAATIVASPAPLTSEDTGLPQLDGEPTPATATTAAAAVVPTVTTTTTITSGGGPPPAPVQAPAQPVHHHPHIPPVEAPTPVRVFKLQFDVRRIICCSQTHAIVGWDFCNGDPELEEASRFFWTVE